MLTEPKAYDWDFAGACSPASNGTYWSKTFSVGIFQWVPKSSGKGLKRSKVVKRIRGNVAAPEEVYREAREWIEGRKLNVGEE